MAGFAAPVTAAKTQTFNLFVRVGTPCNIVLNCYTNKSEEGKTDLDKKVENVLLKQLRSCDLIVSTTLVVTIPSETTRIDVQVGAKKAAIWSAPFDGVNRGIEVQEKAIYDHERPFFATYQTIKLA